MLLYNNVTEPKNTQLSKYPAYSLSEERIPLLCAECLNYFEQHLADFQ